VFTEELYEQLLQDMELALNELASKVPPPQRVPFASSFVYRHVERMPTFAIAAAAFGNQELVERLKSQKRNFELQTGRDH
jgi:hypothetical protein